MGRPRNPILSRERIVVAALELVDETGSLTLPLLAKRLGVSMSSIYHHLANRAEIVEGMRELLSRDFPRPDPGLTWQQEVRRWMRAYRAIMVAHPHLITEFAAHHVNNETTRRAYEDLAGVLEGAGFPPASILGAITALDSFVCGSALELTALEQLWQSYAELDVPLGRAQRAAPWDERSAQAAFELGLDGLILTLERQLDRR